ncbi:MAG: hypothetical protein J6S98_06020 [Lentisphaeria bacterium]|nr:hypothetical protein [Lentisphaeria bacterium]
MTFQNVGTVLQFKPVARKGFQLVADNAEMIRENELHPCGEGDFSGQRENAIFAA